MFIPIPVPLGTSHRCTVSGRALRPNKCVNCGCEYLYVMERKTTGDAFAGLLGDQGDAADRAKGSAIRLLEHGLTKDCDLVGCPDCGHYQPDMIRKIRSHWFLGMFAVWAFLCLGIWILYLTAEVDWNVVMFVGLFFLTPLALLGAGIWGVLRLDHNRNAAKRIVHGTDPNCRVIRKAELEAMIAEEQKAQPQQAESQLVDHPSQTAIPRGGWLPVDARR